MVEESRGEHGITKEIRSAATKLGCTTETLRHRIGVPSSTAISSPARRLRHVGVELRPPTPSPAGSAYVSIWNPDGHDATYPRQLHNVTSPDADASCSGMASADAPIGASLWRSRQSRLVTTHRSTRRAESKDSIHRSVELAGVARTERQLHTKLNAVRSGLDSGDDGTWGRMFHARAVAPSCPTRPHHRAATCGGKCAPRIQAVQRSR